MRPAQVTQPNLEFRAIAEPDPGPRMREVFDAHWPAYDRWMSKRAPGGPSPAECEAQLRVHMPELVPIYEQLREVVGGDDRRSRFLTQYAPTPLIRGCSQAVCSTNEGTFLVRNYDHAPHLCDGIILATRWGGVGVHALTDCLWGALDGVNEAGLAVALAFGGRKVVGLGFSASLLTRYLLQTCETVADARRALVRLPVYMSYNFALVDRLGDRATVFTAPDRAASFSIDPISTNHQLGVEWPEYARFTHSVERRACLAHLVEHGTDLNDCINAFLSPPLFRHEYRKASGTLYTVAYNPGSMDVALYWHGASVVVSPSDATPFVHRVVYPSS